MPGLRDAVTRIMAALDVFRATLPYLPPYSPDPNPIEGVFAKLKSILGSATARTREALWAAIGTALNAFSAHECGNYFAHAGYLHSA
jgi:transposase